VLSLLIVNSFVWLLHCVADRWVRSISLAAVRSLRSLWQCCCPSWIILTQSEL